MHIAWTCSPARRVLAVDHPFRCGARRPSAGRVLLVEGPLPTAPGVVDLERSLLEVKFSVPQPRSGMVSRVEMIDATRTNDCRVVGVTAPAGYGKTTLLAQWALLEDRRSPGCPWTGTTTIPRSCSSCWPRPTPGSALATESWSPT